MVHGKISWIAYVGEAFPVLSWRNFRLCSQKAQKKVALPLLMEVLALRIS
jgi:hypothetical protein